MTTVSSVLVDCLKEFNSLVSHNDLVSRGENVPTDLWTDELGRLRVWAANIGAHQTGQSSLDYRLRDASHIKDQTIRLLDRLRRVLKDLDELYNGADGKEREGEDSSLYGEDETEIQEIYCSLVDTINCLFQMSMIIRRPTQHDRLLGTRKVDTTAFEPYDRQHVENKYPRAERVVVDRLGAAISRRRAGLKYRERHHAKLRKGLDHVLEERDDHYDAISARLSETVASDFEESLIKFEETRSESDASQTSYASSFWSAGDKIAVPARPKESEDGQPFECPFCFFIITVQNRRSWIRHVFKDLMPYVCVFTDCSTPSRLYDSRHEWFQHLQDRHVAGSFSNTEIECPLLCGAMIPGTQLQRHLGQHLEELALFALPRQDKDEDADSNQSQTSPLLPETGFSDLSDEDQASQPKNALDSTTVTQVNYYNGLTRRIDRFGTQYYTETKWNGVSAEDVPLSERHWEDEQGPLRRGCEPRQTAQQRLYYLDHNTRTTTWTRPNVPYAQATEVFEALQAPNTKSTYRQTNSQDGELPAMEPKLKTDLESEPDGGAPRGGKHRHTPESEPRNCELCKEPILSFDWDKHMETGNGQCYCGERMACREYRNHLMSRAHARNVVTPNRLEIPEQERLLQRLNMMALSRERCNRGQIETLQCGGKLGGGCRTTIRTSLQLYYHCCLCDDDDYDHCIECGPYCPNYPVHDRMPLFNNRKRRESIT